jgi:hypothetical protein
MSARGRLSRIVTRDMDRLEAQQRDDPAFRLSVKDAQTIKLLAQADAILQKRVASAEEVEDEKATEEAAANLVKKITAARRANPTALEFRGEDDSNTDQ